MTPTLRDAARLQWETRLSRSRGECGCFTGAICGLVATVAIGVYWLASRPPLNARSITIACAAVVAASLVGKFGRVALARLTLRRDLKLFAELYPAGPSITADPEANP